MEELNISDKSMEKLFAICSRQWLDVVSECRHLFEQFGSRFPQELLDECSALEKRFGRA